MLYLLISWNRQYFAPQNSHMNGRFHSGAERVNRPLSALQIEPCKCESTWSLFSGVCLLFPKRESTARDVHRFPVEQKSALLHRYQPVRTVLHPLTMHLLPQSRGVATMLFSEEICTVLIGRSDFGQSVYVQMFFRRFGPFRCLSGMPGILSRQGVENTPYLRPCETGTTSHSCLGSELEV